MILSTVALFLAGHQKGMMNKPAPEFVGKEWLNVEKPLSMAARKGSVTLIHFWTFACINCKNNLPAIQRLADRYKKEGVELISIHTPELAQERDVANVKKAVEKYGIKYPVLIDGSGANWKAWGTDSWPTLYVVDKYNRIRGGWIGELNYAGHNGEGAMQQLIRELLAEK